MESRRRPLQRITISAALAALVITVGCSGDDGTNPPPPPDNSPAAVNVVSGNGQSGTVGSTLQQSLVVRVTDSSGSPLGNITITWSVTAGGGSLASATSSTDAQGQAQNQLTLGTSPGANAVQAAVQGTGLTAQFTATANPDLTPASLDIESGDGQTAPVGATLAPLQVRVTNAMGDGLAGVAVTAAVTEGDGEIVTQPPATDGDGFTAAVFQLGATPGANSVTLSVTSDPSLTVTFTATGTDAGGSVPAAIEIVSGDAQSANVNSTLNGFVVRVTDDQGAPVAGVGVTAAVLQGGGQIVQAPPNTDADGRTTAVYRLGATPGQNSVELSVTDDPDLSVTFTATATEPATTAINVADDFFAPMEADVDVGGRAEWTWMGSNQHNVTWVSASFTDSPTQTSGTHLVQFPAMGDFDYYCTVHGTPTSGMRGTIRVR